MRYLGGKMRQSGEILEAVRAAPTGRPFERVIYAEPFCGAMWSACAVIKTFPQWQFILNDANPYLMTFWAEAVLKGWNPPETVTEDCYDWYNSHRPKDDPMTGYLGFAWSFGGKFFGGKARTNGVFKGSYSSTKAKINLLRKADVQLLCQDYQTVKIPKGSIIYLDPPYENRTRQSRTCEFDRGAYKAYAESLVQDHHHFVIASEFIPNGNWEILHDYGDTVVRHLNARPKDGTREYLMRVR